MRSQSRATNPRRLGFTLIELMVVIVLIAILTATIIPEMKGTYENALLRSTARRLVDVFNLANSHAISINEIHRVRLDRRNGRYFIERTAREGEKGSRFVRDREVPGGEGPIDPRISIEIRAAEDSSEAIGPGASISGEARRNENRDDTISFYADGTADAQEVLLRDGQGFQVLLRINPVTSRVHIIELMRM